MMILGKGPGERWTCSIRAKPSVFGNWLSDRSTRKGLASKAALLKASRASSAVLTATTSAPQEVRLSCKRARLVECASTTSARTPGRSATLAGPAIVFAGEPGPNLAVNKNIEPFPALLSTQILPFINPTIFEQMVKPRPVPPNRRVTELSAWEKA